MKEVVILSGKGGVGKSMITGSLGVIFAREIKMVLADTDVDAPNLHLTVASDLKDSQQVKTSEKAFVDYEKCIQCMECLEVCRFDAITGTDYPVMIPYACEGCGACSLICPEEAIAVLKVVNGWISTFNADDQLLISGGLKMGESSSGMLVDLVKEKARKEADKCGAGMLLIDGPPGIGCPVIAALKGADYAAVVTEPTPAGLHDLTRVMEVVRHFEIPAGLVINRSDINPAGPGMIADYAGKEDLPILAEIPYDTRIPQAIACGLPVVSAYPEAPVSLIIRELAVTLLDRTGALGKGGRE